jgi:hypothetical protein
LFVQDADLKKYIQTKSTAEKQLDYAKRFSILALEAKYWDRLEKYRKGEVGDKEDAKRCDLAKPDAASSLSPSGQILEYIKLLQCDDPPRNQFGIVTDGKTWRLHHHQYPEDKFYEFNLGGLLYHLRDDLTEGIDISDDRYSIYEEAARYFYFFFSKDVLFNENEPTFVDSILQYSKDYVERAEEDLKQRFIEAMKFACNGLPRSCKKKKESIDKQTVRDSAESQLFNILFIKSCEANNVLPLYVPAYREQSLTSTIEKLRRFDPSLDEKANEKINLKPAFTSFEYRNEGLELFETLQNLTRIIEQGPGSKDNFGFSITAFQESIFQEKDREFIEKHPLTNIEMVKILFQLGYLEEDNKWKLIPYNSFTPRQLGSIYESFLEFVIDLAEDDLEYKNKQWKIMSKSTKDKLKSSLDIWKKTTSGN